MNIRRFILGTAAALVMVASTAQAVVMQTVYKGTVTPGSNGGGLFGIADAIGGLPFELSFIWDSDDLIRSNQIGAVDGSGPGLVSFVARPVSISIKIANALRTLLPTSPDDALSEIRANDRLNSGEFSTQTQFSVGNDGSGSEFSCALGITLPSRQPLTLNERYHISNATPLNQGGGRHCGLLQAMTGEEFGLDATSLTVAPLISPVPVPPAIPLLLTGLAALFGVRRWRRG